MYDQFIWDYCPVEILCLIFRLLDVESLITCTSVNKSWRNIAYYTCQHYGLWQQVAEHVIFGKGASFKRKSTLNWRDVYFNFVDWKNIRRMKTKLVHTFLNDEDILNIHVYKDNLIVVCTSYVKYIEISTFEIRRSIPVSAIDFQETDYMIVKATTDGELKRLQMYGKSSPDKFELNENESKCFDGIRFYQLQNDSCYVVNKIRGLQLYKYDHKTWKYKYLTRYYGPKSITNLYVYNEDDPEMYFLFKSGDLWRKIIDANDFQKITPLGLPEKEMKFAPIMFGVASCVVRAPCVTSMEMRLQKDSNQMVLIYPDLSCATQHGDALFLGFDNGKIEIHLISRLPRSAAEPELVIDISKIDKSTSELIVKAIDVHEAKGSHHVLIACTHKIYHVDLTYYQNEHGTGEE